MTIIGQMPKCFHDLIHTKAISERYIPNNYGEERSQFEKGLSSERVVNFSLTVTGEEDKLVFLVIEKHFYGIKQICCQMN